MFLSNCWEANKPRFPKTLVPRKPKTGHDNYDNSAPTSTTALIRPYKLVEIRGAMWCLFIKRFENPKSGRPFFHFFLNSIPTWDYRFQTFERMVSKHVLFMFVRMCSCLLFFRSKGQREFSHIFSQPSINSNDAKCLLFASFTGNLSALIKSGEISRTFNANIHFSC
jgi:hypothetical protein